MFLGIEIGGTKLQLGVGRGDGTPPIALERLTDRIRQGAATGILQQIEAARAAADRAAWGAAASASVSAGRSMRRPDRVIKSHQIDGWEDFELGKWCQQKFNLPTQIENDCDAAALAEARFGAGRDQRVVFYVTVGTGVGGGMVVDGQMSFTVRGRRWPKSAICARPARRSAGRNGRVGGQRLGHRGDGPIADRRSRHATADSAGGRVAMPGGRRPCGNG